MFVTVAYFYDFSFQSMLNHTRTVIFFPATFLIVTVFNFKIHS